MALRCWGIIERQTNQQQKAKLEKQMYNTLTVRPNIVKPLCVSSEAAYVMRAGLSVGEDEQPSPSNRLHAALL